MELIVVECVDLARDSAPRTHLTGLINGFRHEGVDVCVVLPQPSAPVTIGQEVVLIRCGRSKLTKGPVWDVVAHIELLNLLRKRRARDVAVYERYQVISVLGPTVSRLFRVPYIAEFNGLTGQELLANGYPRWLARLADWVDRFQFSHCDIAVCPTEEIRKELRSSTYKHPPISLVVPNAVDDQLFYPKGKLDMRRALGWDESAFIIGFVGSVAPWQGLELLVDAIADLPEDRRGKVQVKIVGGGRELEKIKKHVFNLELEGTVHFVGEVPFSQVPDYINAFDIGFVHRVGLRGGATPIKLWEYMACGLPCLAGNVAGMSEEVTRARSGVVFSSKDDLTQKIVGLVDGEYDLKTMGRNAHRYVKHGHTWRSRARTIINAIRQLLSDKVERWGDQRF